MTESLLELLLELEDCILEVLDSNTTSVKTLDCLRPVTKKLSQVLDDEWGMSGS